MISLISVCPPKASNEDLKVWQSEKDSHVSLNYTETETAAIYFFFLCKPFGKGVFFFLEFLVSFSQLLWALLTKLICHSDELSALNISVYLTAAVKEPSWEVRAQARLLWPCFYHGWIGKHRRSPTQTSCLFCRLRFKFKVLHSLVVNCSLQWKKQTT